MLTVIFLQEHFTRYSVSDSIVSDNSAQFTAREFKNLCKMYSSEHITNPPYHPRSKGQAERILNTFKKALTKSKK